MQGTRELAHAECTHSSQLASLVANQEYAVVALTTLTTHIEKLVGKVEVSRSCIDYEVREPLKAMRENREYVKKLHRRPVPCLVAPTANRYHLDPQDLQRIVSGAARVQSSVTRLKVELHELPRRVGEHLPVPSPSLQSPAPTTPLVEIRDVLAAYTDQEILHNSAGRHDSGD